MLALRELVFTTAARTPGVGELEETLKWGQPSYLTKQSGSGSTVRIDAMPSTPGGYAIYFHCPTDLVETFRKRFGRKLRYEGNRSIVFSESEELPGERVAECVALALTHHLRKRPGRVAIGSLIR